MILYDHFHSCGTVNSLHVIKKVDHAILYFFSFFCLITLNLPAFSSLSWIYFFFETDTPTMLVFVSFGAIVNAVERRVDNQET